ncbi:MAG: hypothetical protein ACYDHY_15130 [Acidiferrobacterales bacterium]
MPGAKWYRHAVRRFCPNCGVELRRVTRPRGLVLHMLMSAAIFGYLLFFISHPSIMLHIGFWALEGGLLLIMLPLAAALFKWGFDYLVVPNEKAFAAATSAGTNRTIRYYPSRREAWRGYWKTWRHKLWFMQVLLAAWVGPALLKPPSRPLTAAYWGLTFAVALPVIPLVMALVPQILFKNAERTVQVGPRGWLTNFGLMAGRIRAWAEAASIEEWAGQVVITSTSGNALIIPARALPDSASWRQFVQDIRQWHRLYRG